MEKNLIIIFPDFKDMQNETADKLGHWKKSHNTVHKPFFFHFTPCTVFENQKKKSHSK